MGDYFVAHLPRLPAGSTAQAHVISPFIECTKVTQTVTYISPANITTQRVIQTWAAIFDIPVDVIPKSTGISGAIVYRGNAKFTLDLFVGNVDTNETDVIHVIPVAGFGRRYCIHTFQRTPVLIVLSGDEPTTVSIRLNNIRAVNIEAKPNQVVWTGDTVTVHMRRHEALTSSRCDGTVVTTLSLTGTVITSQNPVGVIAGNCLTDCSEISVCGQPRRKNILLDMLIPEVSYGKKFLIPTLNLPGSFRFVYIATSQDNTIVEFSTSHFTDHTSLTIPTAGTWEYYRSRYPQVIRADKPVVCYLLVLGSCTDVYNTAVMTLLPPTELFYNTYVWHTLHRSYFPVKLYLALVVNVRDVLYLNIEGVNIRKLMWDPIKGDRSWRTATTAIRHDDSQAYIHGREHGFGCYLYSMDQGLAFMQTRGFIVADISYTTSCKQSLQAMNQSDLVDNDCDFKIDEERLNSIDDDNDGMVDEDLAEEMLVEGVWTEWEEWRCVEPCGVSTFISHRTCTNPAPKKMGKACVGLAVRKNSSPCKAFKTCDQECKRRFYGYGCALRCMNCVSDCDPTNGSCRSCMPGWKDPHLACTTPCPMWTYGFQCLQMCEPKCGEDCADRVNGSCPAGNNLFWLFMWVMLMSFLLAFSFVLMWWNTSSRANVLVMWSSVRRKNYVWKLTNDKGKKRMVLTTHVDYYVFRMKKKKKGKKGKKGRKGKKGKPQEKQVPTARIIKAITDVTEVAKDKKKPSKTEMAKEKIRARMIEMAKDKSRASKAEVASDKTRAGMTEMASDKTRASMIRSSATASSLTTVKSNDVTEPVVIASASTQPLKVPASGKVTAVPASGKVTAVPASGKVTGAPSSSKVTAATPSDKVTAVTPSDKVTGI